MKRFIDWLAENPQTRVPIVVASIALSGVILGGFLTTIFWPYLKAALEKAWDVVERKIYRKRFEHNYLDWVVKAHEFLPILPSTLVPVTQVNVQELDKLYISLTIAAADTDEEVAIANALQESPAVVILGDPGAGKTTMLRFLALTFAQARRRRSSARSLRERQRDTVRIHASQRRVVSDLGFANYPLPIFLYLNRLREVQDWPKSRSLLDALIEEWSAIDKLRDLPPGFLKDKLNRGECIFLLDAFDELGTQAARDRVAEHIGQLAALAPQGNRFIVTSRIVGYDGQLSQYGFSVLKVQKLSWSMISELVTKWYDSLGEPMLATQLLDTLKANKRIADLAVNPMLLSLIVLVQYVKRIIPERRHLLYDECVKILVERRYAPPDVQQAYNRVLPGEEATLILQEIARFLHDSHLREIPRGFLVAEVIPNIVSTMDTSVAQTRSSSTVLNNIEERSQLLVERGLNEDGEPVMAFSHLTFQEYLTAVSLKESISRRGERFVTEELIGAYAADSEWWEETALLFAAQLNSTQRATFFKRLYPDTPVGGS
jgi:predicted NACHT family NTPase